MQWGKERKMEEKAYFQLNKFMLLNVNVCFVFHRKYKKEINHLQDEGKSEDEFLKNIDATANYKALLMVRNYCIILEL